MAARTCGRRIGGCVGIGIATLVIAVPLGAEAMCMSGALRAWPSSGTTLPTNAHVIVEGYGTEAWVADTIASRFPAVVGPAGKVPLRVVEKNVGGFVLWRSFDGSPDLIQVVLAPTRELAPGTRWDLHVDGADHLATWTTASGPDRVKPRWSSRPRQAEVVYRRHGCGPEAYAGVEVPVSDDGDLVAFRADVKEVGGPRLGRYIVERGPEGSLQIGHGMCSGAFSLEPGTEYRVTIGAIDLAGNESTAPGTVLVRGPGPDDAEVGYRPRRVQTYRRPAPRVPERRFEPPEVPEPSIAESPGAATWISIATTAVAVLGIVLIGARVRVRRIRTRTLQRLRRSQEGSVDREPDVFKHRTE